MKLFPFKGAVMGKGVGRILLFLAITSLVAACTSKLSYRANPPDPSSPPDKDLIFSLRNSTILVTSPAKVAAQANSGTPLVENVCKTAGQDALKKCLDDINVNAIPSRDGKHVFSATPSRGTTVTSTAVDSDPLMVKTITVNYKNPAVGIIGTTGAGAVTGFAIAGPYGAAAGGVFGLVASLVTAQAAPGRAQTVWTDLLCRTELEVVNKSNPPRAVEADAQLLLPVAVEYGSADAENDCWHLLPLAKQDVSAAKPDLSGWVYRFQPTIKEEVKFALPPVVTPEWDSMHGNGKLRPPFVSREEYFRDEEERTTFPISACRRIEVQITWWQRLELNQIPANIYSVMVADSAYIHPVRLPKSGVVTVLPACGGFSSSTATSSSSNELIDAIIKQAQAVKAAQDSYNNK
jgi:hypothetical protein